MKLYLDSTNNKSTLIKLDDKTYSKEYDSPRDQDVFGFLESILEKNNANFEDITQIQVNPGPGSFTGTRVGIAIANALGFSLKLKVNGQEPPAKPVYDQEPNITTPKRNQKEISS